MKNTIIINNEIVDLSYLWKIGKVEIQPVYSFRSTNILHYKYMFHLYFLNENINKGIIVTSKERDDKVYQKVNNFRDKLVEYWSGIEKLNLPTFNLED